MKKNLFLVMGLMAALNLAACKHEDEKPEDNNKPEAIKACSEISADDVKNSCVKCSVETKNFLVCGTCTAADAATDSANYVKRQCVASVEGAKEFAQTLTCELVVSNKYFYVEYKSTSCTTTEVCNKQKGICEEDASLLGPCASPTYSCDGSSMIIDYPDACTDFADDAVDCSNLGGCVGTTDAECLFLKKDNVCQHKSVRAGTAKCTKTVTGTQVASNKYYDPDCPADDIICKANEDCVTDAENLDAICKVADASSDSDANSDDSNSDADTDVDDRT